MPNPLEGLITRQEIDTVAENENLIFDDDRKSILEAIHSIDVQACPGSGKTTLIAAKLILLAKNWNLKHQGICVLSHTNVAKNEIIDRLKHSKTIEAQNLLSYPHFIGTIQEFVGKFMAFPFIRSKGIKINRVDTDNCIDLIYSKISVGTRNYIDRKSQHSNVLYDFDMSYADGSISINVPTFPNGSDRPSYVNLLSVRNRLLSDGYFFYKDIFSLALKVLKENQDLPPTLQSRFPCVFLDEMQDTQKFQDELLSEIFPLGEPSITIQRFGDPDQAIFQGVGNEEPNESYNQKSLEEMDFVINKSHRFDGLLADMIKCHSFNEVSLETELTEESLANRAEAHVTGESFEHTVFVFNDDTRDNVIPCFFQSITNQFAEQYKLSERFLAKVVGAVGNEIDPNKDQLKIGHYWPDYDKSKSKMNFKETSLIDAARYCRKSSSIDWADSYKFLLNCILKLMRINGNTDENGRYFSVSSLRDTLKNNGNWLSFRKNIYSILKNNEEIDQQFWECVCNKLSENLELANIPLEASEYLAFSEVTVPDNTLIEEDNQENASIISLIDNKIMHTDGFQIELSTIHGVKGETHDATLIVETKNYTFDLEAMLPYLTGELPSAETPNTEMRDKPNSRRANKVFMKQFYVAMSRPKHLLCLALHADRISEAQQEILRVKGWRIEVI